jgi:cytochrome b6-f complex iron-sulfur subunit
MSVSEILAAARGSAASDEPAPSPPAAAEKPKAAKPLAGAKPGAMSVSDILAAARGGSGAGEAAKPAATPAAAKPKAVPAKAPAAKESAAKPAAAKAGAPIDTSSILAAARSGSKPGPISKAEAAARSLAPAAPRPAAAPPMPAKPDYATPKPAVSKASSRRGFFSVLFGSFLAVGFTTFGLTNLLWTLGLARFMFPNILIEPPSKFKVGFPNDFAPGSVADRFKAQFGIWVVNTEYEGAPQIVALRTVCTHLGCTPNWLEAEQKFKCPCHGSGFYKDGINFEGPAPRPLERYAIRLADDGQLEVDKSKIFQQEMGQWSDPACFVPV